MKFKFFILIFMILSGCVSAPKTEEAKVAIPDDSPQYLRYIVQRGDTFWKIAQMAYNDSRKWHKIFKANSDRIKGIHDLAPGEVIIIPVE